MDSKRLTAEEWAEIESRQADRHAFYRPQQTPILATSAMRDIDRLLADRAALEQRVGELEAALRPFAEEGADHKWPWVADDVFWSCCRMGDFRAAAKALADGGHP